MKRVNNVENKVHFRLKICLEDFLADQFCYQLHQLRQKKLQKRQNQTITQKKLYIDHKNCPFIRRCLRKMWKSKHFWRKFSSILVCSGQILFIKWNGFSSFRTSDTDDESSIIRSSVEGGIKVVREFGSDCVNAVKDKKKPVDDFIATGIGHSQCKFQWIRWKIVFWICSYKNVNFVITSIVAFDYLNQPANGIHRAGAIAVGAVSGYIIAIRRGFFRRLLYTSIGGLGVASICYPKEAEIYWQQALNESKTYATILYNFAYGGMSLSSINLILYQIFF